MRKAVCINTDGDVSRKHGMRGSRAANFFAFPRETKSVAALKTFVTQRIQWRLSVNTVK
jgi:hypothetical protein